MAGGNRKRRFLYNLGMDIKRPLFIAAAALFLPLSGFSADYVIVRSTYYLTARQQELADFPAPPAAGSEADRADMATLKDWQGKRTAYGEFFGDISPFPAPMPAPAAEVFRRPPELTVTFPVLSAPAARISIGPRCTSVPPLYEFVAQPSFTQALASVSPPMPLM